tara:strand:+ start:206 stop:487 length:282 start_codon:yes stop_codon:yes gene_type:complete
MNHPRINDHNLIFTFLGTKGDYDVSVSVPVPETSFHRSFDIGSVKKAPGGWTGFDLANDEVTYRTGPRHHAAEALAVNAGFLDGNYNAIPLEA